jgi:hypothetical protein
MSFLFEYVLNIKFVITGDNLKNNNDKYVHRSFLIRLLTPQMFNHVEPSNTNGLAQRLVVLLPRRKIAEFSHYIERRSQEITAVLYENLASSSRFCSPPYIFPLD